MSSISSKPVSSFQIEDFGETLVVNSTFLNGCKDEYIYPTNATLNSTIIFQGTPSSEYLVHYNRSYFELSWNLIRSDLLNVDPKVPILSLGGQTPFSPDETLSVSDWYALCVNPNTYAIFKQARLLLASTTVESVNDIGQCVDAKMSLLGVDSMNTCHSQSFLMPINTYVKGCPPVTKRLEALSTPTGNFRIIWPQDRRNNSDATLLAGVPIVYDQRVILDLLTPSSAPHPSLIRSQQLVNLDLPGRNTVYTIQTINGAPDPPLVASTTYIGDVLLGPNPPVIPAATITCKLYLGFIFGFFERDVLMAPTQFQIMLDKGNVGDMCGYTYGDSIKMPNLSINIQNIKLVLVQKKATSEALAFYNEDKVFGVNHYSLLTNNLVGTNNSMSLAVTGGINWFCMSFTNRENYMSWDKIPPAKKFQFYINYRCQQTPMNIESLTMPDLTGAVDTLMHQRACYGMAWDNSHINTKTFFEHYAGFKHEYSANYMGNGVLYNQMDYAKSQFRVYFDLIPGMSNSIDIASGPLQIFYIAETNDYNVQPGTGAQLQLNTVICRTNIVKYSSQGYLMSVITNGPA